MNESLSPVLPSRMLRVAAGLLLVMVPVGFLLFFTLLQMRFDYPDILLRPAGEVLSRFDEQRATVLPLWTGMFASAAMFIPLAMVVPAVLQTRRGVGSSLVVTGVLAGVVQAVGLSRWVFAAPELARLYAEAGTTEPTRDAALVVFHAMNQFLGVGIGETLGYAFTSAWTILLGSALRPGRPWIAWVGIGCGAVIALGCLAPTGHATFTEVTTPVAYTAWSLWLVWLGAVCLGARTGLGGRIATPSGG